jgi:hypothetical protein
VFTVDRFKIESPSAASGGNIKKNTAIKSSLAYGGNIKKNTAIKSSLTSNDTKQEIISDSLVSVTDRNHEHSKTVEHIKVDKICHRQTHDHRPPASEQCKPVEQNTCK